MQSCVGGCARLSPELASFLTALQSYGLLGTVDEQGVLATFQAFLASCDMPTYVLGVLSFRPDGSQDVPMLWSNMEPWWLEEYEACNHGAHDHVVKQANAAQGRTNADTDGFRWGRFTAEQRDLTPETRRVVEGATAGGLANAVSFWGRSEPIAGSPNTRSLGFSIGTPDRSERNVQKLFDARHNELLIATFAMLPVLRPLVNRLDGGFHGNLTQRERDVLLRYSEGLRPERIAERLGLSRVTVDMHAANARRKLGTQTMPAAVAKAIRYGLI